MEIWSCEKKNPTSYKTEKFKKVRDAPCYSQHGCWDTEVTYYAQLRISGIVGIILMPAEMPFRTNISTRSQSWLQKSFGGRNKQNNISMLTDTKPHTKEGRLHPRAASFTDYDVPSRPHSHLIPLHSVTAPLSSLSFGGAGEAGEGINSPRYLNFLGHTYHMPGVKVIRGYHHTKSFQNLLNVNVAPSVTWLWNSIDWKKWRRREVVKEVMGN